MVPQGKDMHAEQCKAVLLCLAATSSLLLIDHLLLLGEVLVTIISHTRTHNILHTWLIYILILI